MEAKPSVTLCGGIGKIAKLRTRERQGTESFTFIYRWTSGRREWLRGVAVTMERVCGSAAGVIRRAERANLEG